MKDLTHFLNQYENATNTHDFNQVQKLIAPNAVYWFSDGSFVGTKKIRAAFESTWTTIKDETYSIKNIDWITVSPDNAVCLYDYHWSGIIDGISKSGQGRGTNILVKQKNNWLIIHEHLSSERN
jgi:ketosteroid isomerase-like protein